MSPHGSHTLARRLRVLFLTSPLLAVALGMLSADSSDEVRDRSPRDVAVSADGRWAITANHTSDSASLVDLQNGKVSAEVRCGGKPFCVALSHDGARAVVTNWRSSSLTVLSIQPPQLHTVAEIAVGPEPRGVALSRDGKRAYVAVGVLNEIVVVDVEQECVVDRYPVPREPWHVALSADEHWLVAGCAGAGTSCLIDLQRGVVADTAGVFGMNVRQVAIDPSGEWAYVVHTHERGFPMDVDSMSRGWAIANRVSRVALNRKAPRESIALDPPGRAAGDSEGIAVSPNGEWLAVAAGGTHELLLFRQPLAWAPYGLTGDFMDGRNGASLRRLRLGGRPIAVRFTPDSKTVVVANYLGNSLQVIDLSSGAVTETVALGGREMPSLARQGAAIFMDAQKTFQQWFSCNTCHAEGHTNHARLDTLNDGAYGQPKKVPSLRGVAHTMPYTWHGWQRKLEDAIAKSVVDTMHGPALAPDEVTALAAFLQTLDYPVNPNREENGNFSEAARRGETLFRERGCVKCHAPPYFTSDQMVNVGTGVTGDRFPGFNPPSLLNVHDRAPYLHDGRAKTLEELLTRHHRIDRLTGGPPLVAEEVSDLIEFVRSL